MEKPDAKVSTMEPGILDNILAMSTINIHIISEPALKMILLRKINFVMADFSPAVLLDLPANRAPSELVWPIQ